MNVNEYWDIINNAANKHPEDEASYANYVNDKLYNLTYKDRHQFSQFTREYLFHGDAAGVMMLCKVLDDYFTDDSLLYFTLWVISRGKDFYLGALANPDLLVRTLTENDKYQSFEMFMSLGLDFEEESDDYSDEDIASWELTESEKAKSPLR